MGCNGASIKNTCGTKQYATCVYYEKEVPAFSSITDSCITLEDTTLDIYNILGDIKDELNLSGLVGSCLTYPTQPSLLQVLTVHQTEICELKELLATQNQTIATMQQQIIDLQNNNCS